MEKNNIFAVAFEKSNEEIFETILQKSGCRIERIISRGHKSPEGFWYDQDETEWVMLVQGQAGLRFEGQDHVTILNPGDYLQIDRHTRHRVEWTSPDCDTLWLAVHIAHKDQD